MPKSKLKKIHRALMRADKATHEAMKPYEDSVAVKLLSRASKIGNQPQLYAMSGALLAAGLARRDRRMARAGGRMIASLAAATLAKNFVKHRIDRTRPRSADGNDDHKPKRGRSRAKEETSFPSGHSAGAIAVARAFAREYPQARLPALGGALGLALARIPRCAHYPTDVGAGLAIGLAAEAALAALWPSADPSALSPAAASDS